MSLYKLLNYISILYSNLFTVNVLHLSVYFVYVPVTKKGLSSRFLTLILLYNLSTVFAT